MAGKLSGEAIFARKSMRLFRWTSRFLAALLLTVWCVRVANAQNDPIFDAKGFQQNRDYFSQEPFEHIDTMTGGLVLTFTDLVLPGNAGRDLRIQRTYNSKGGVWSFGIAGLVMAVSDPGWPD